MATRSITEIFILMRNNAIQSRNFYSEQVGDFFLVLYFSYEIYL